MTFTYTPAAPTDLTRVRFHLGDTDAESAKFDDETLNFLLAEYSNDIGETVMAAIKGLIARIAGDANFTADWLTVDTYSAIKGLKDLLILKGNEFGLSAVTIEVRPMLRLDSNQTADTLDYTDGAGGEWS